MLTLVASTVLALGGQDAATTQEDAGEELLVQATADLAKAESYSFTSTTKTERPGGGGGWGGGGEPKPTAGVYKKGLPMLLVNGDVIAYKNADVLVRKNDAGEWEALDPEAAFGGPGGGGRGGGGGSDGGGAGRGGRGRGFGGGGRELFALLRQVAPHEMLADFAAKKASVTHAKEDEVDVYTGHLTEEAAQGMSGFGRGGFGGGGEMTVTGTYRIDVMGGKVVSATFVVERSGDFNGRAFEMTTEQKITLDKVGSSELEVPEEVLAAFDS